MKLIDIITPDELEAELFADTSKDSVYAKLDESIRAWKPYADMFGQRVLLGDIPQSAFLFWMTLLGAIGNVLAEKEKRQVH